jgi:hypothetical protein
MYQFCISSLPKTDFPTTSPECGDNYCTTCPSDATCLSNCEYNTTPDTCEPCSASCTSGCDRTTDCSTCEDQLCNVCPAWDPCETCIANASFVGIVCECDLSFFFDGSQCRPCDSRCSECNDGTNLRCPSCADGFFKQVGT